MMDARFFVSEQLHERPVTLEDGSTHTLHFRELSAAQMRAYQIAERSEDDEVQAGAIAKLIAASVCNPDGSAAMSHERAKSLKPKAARAIFTEILKINGMAVEEAKKPSPGEETTSGSGTPSPSPSAAAQ